MNHLSPSSFTKTLGLLVGIHSMLAVKGGGREVIRG
jgi:hypothetical protein